MAAGDLFFFLPYIFWIFELNEVSVPTSLFTQTGLVNIDLQESFEPKLKYLKHAFSLLYLGPCDKIEHPLCGLWSPRIFSPRETPPQRYTRWSHFTRVVFNNVRPDELPATTMATNSIYIIYILYYSLRKLSPRRPYTTTTILQPLHIPIYIYIRTHTWHEGIETREFSIKSAVEYVTSRL